MTSDAKTVEEYLDSVPADRQEYFRELRDVINANIPAGFEECINYGHIGWVVPHSRYPAGYHCDPKLPLPFAAIASQKNFVAFYHMGIYADAGLLAWFTSEYAKRAAGKLDMGKSCVRFKKPATIPLDLIGELIAKITPDDWIRRYESSIRDARRKS